MFSLYAKMKAYEKYRKPKMWIFKSIYNPAYSEIITEWFDGVCVHECVHTFILLSLSICNICKYVYMYLHICK